jgi:hypothetical protein
VWLHPFAPRRSAAWRRRAAGSRRGQVQSSISPLVHAMLSPGPRLVRSAPPARPPHTAQTPGPCQGRNGAERSGTPPGGFSLDGVASGGRVVEMPGVTARQGEDALSSGAEGGVMRSMILVSWRRPYRPPVDHAPCDPPRLLIRTREERRDGTREGS